tara:strand:- start:2407 stop:3171 length:765 start_codon:yes stop_codon:yes gene_type:complete
MNSKTFAISIVLILSGYLGFSQQSMSDYSYIEVPEIFDFQQSKDQYQINSLTKFLFNKYGFHAYFSKDLPNVTKCDGLFADVETELGFIHTKMVVVVKDCNGVELFRSAEGKSKLKEYSKTYSQALRNAFESFKHLGVSQKEIETQPIAEATSPTTTEQMSTSESGKAPSITFSNYTSDGVSYLLHKTASGYSLYEEGLAVEDDLLLLGKLKFQDTAMKFVDVQGKSYKALFNQNMNLTIKLSSGDKVYALKSN